MTRVDISGKRFGRAVVLYRAESRSGRATWRCLCDCGSEFETNGDSLKAGSTKSCGCLNDETRRRPKTHGLTRTKTYRSWEGMLHRCLYESQQNYKYYGGRGIKICDRWRRFENFLADMGERPDGLTLDRVDVNGDYEPSNCRWVSMAVQNKNKRPAGDKHHVAS